MTMLQGLYPLRLSWELCFPPHSAFSPLRRTLCTSDSPDARLKTQPISHSLLDRSEPLPPVKCVLMQTPVTSQ